MIFLIPSCRAEVDFSKSRLQRERYVHAMSIAEFEARLARKAARMRAEKAQKPPTTDLHEPTMVSVSHWGLRESEEIQKHTN